ncbi:MAG: helix-turn-helix domain-containing protein [Nakamurella sp.]
MTTVIDVLRNRGYSDIDEDSLARAVDDLLPPAAVADGPAELEQEFMQANSGLSTDPVAVSGAVRRLAARRITQVAQTLDTQAVTLLLGLHRTRVQHLRQAGELYAYRDGRHNRYPRWQFTPDDRVLPGLRQVLSALGPAHRSVVAGFMTTPQPELDRGNGPESAARWLADNGDPRLVIELAGAVREPW